VSTRSPRPRPTGGRAMALAVVLSLLLPGLGHVYMNRLGRALIWFGGLVLVAAVLAQGDQDRALAVSMGAAIGAMAAIDIALVTWLDSRVRRRL
jgi:hypothetical protein